MKKIDLYNEFNKIIGKDNNLISTIFKEIEKEEKKYIKNSKFLNYPIIYKSYYRFPEIKLPKPKNINIKLIDVLYKRKSTREFSDRKIDIKTISALLYFSVGIKNINKKENSRFYPSAGARYPTEIYLIANNTELNGKNSYLFHYYPLNHSLEKLWVIKKKELRKIIFQNYFLKASVLVIISSFFLRMNIKYGYNKGFIYSILEVGHVAQNFYLIGEALGLGVCEIGGFSLRYLNNLLDLPKEKEAPLIIMALG